MKYTVVRRIGCLSALYFCSLLIICTPVNTYCQEKRRPQYDAAAVIKLISVRVLDKDGNPVRNLTRADFVLFDNGREMAITEFEVHTVEPSHALPAVDPISDLAGETPRTQRQFFLFLDIQGSDINGIDNAKEAALHFVDTQLLPGDAVGIIGFKPMTGFFIQEYLTDDHERIVNGIKKAKETRGFPGFISGAGGGDSVGSPPGQGSVRGSGGGTDEPGFNASRSESSIPFGGVRTTISVPGSSIHHRRDFLSRMSDLAEALKYIPGNKNLIFFSGRDIAAGAAQSLGKLFAGAGTPVYVVNTKNWIVQGVMQLSVKKKHIWEEHPLQELSLASGGRYFADIEDTTTISQQIQSMSGNYYVLGYYVKENWDGKYHTIRVTVDRPESMVFAQAGYFNPKPFDELSEFEKDLHLADILFTDSPNAIDPLPIPLESLFIAGRDGLNFLLIASLSVHEKTGAPPEPVEIYASLKNNEGKLVMMNRGEADLSSFNEQDLVMYFPAYLPAGGYECRIACRAKKTGQANIGTIRFSLPASQDAPVFLSSPLIFAEGVKSPILKLVPGKPGGKGQTTLSDIYRIAPKDHRLIVRELPQGTESLLAVLPVTARIQPRPEINFILRLLPEGEGEAAALAGEIVEVRHMDDATDIIVLKIGLPDLQEGTYSLEIAACEGENLLHSALRTILVR